MSISICLLVWLLLLSLVRRGFSTITQVHIALGDTPDHITVAWSSDKTDTGSVVQYRESGDTTIWQKTGTSRLFVDGGVEQRSQYLHSVNLRNLKPLTLYRYRAGGNGDWSEWFSFRTISTDPTWAPIIAVVGDIGVKGFDKVGPLLEEDLKAGKYNVLVGLGDYAYNLNSNEGRQGDQFMRLMEPIIANVPFMVATGNHESEFQFLHYRERFDMPNKKQSSNFYYSTNIGQVHLIEITVEFYYKSTYDEQMIKKQYDWLIADLENANLPENRQRYPWVHVITHWPLYCSAKSTLYCVTFPEEMRKRRPGIAPLSLEDVWYKYGVDIVSTGHVHNYERNLPVYNHELMLGSPDDYYNPRATIHIVNGAGGNFGSTYSFVDIPNLSSALRALDFGYVRYQAMNYTHLQWNFVSAKQDGKIIDSVWFIQHKHGSFGNVEDAE